MGRDHPDLPDPLENQDAAAGGGADDLLSQLAGDEIDRMLAEADAESSSAPTVEEGAGAVEAVAQQTEEGSPASEPAVAEVPATGAAAAGQPAIDSQLEDLFNALNEPAAAPVEAQAEEAAATPVAEAPVAEQPPLDSQLDDLFNALNEPAAEPEEVAETKPPVSVAATELDSQLEKLAQELLPISEQEHAVTPVEGAAASEAPQQTGPVAEAVPDERAALLAEAPEEKAGAEEEESGEAVPWYLRPLMWINSPFASMSDPAREALGKVALATLLFSVTVLTFLALTRHRL